MSHFEVEEENWNSEQFGEKVDQINIEEFKNINLEILDNINIIAYQKVDYNFKVAEIEIFTQSQESIRTQHFSGDPSFIQGPALARYGDECASVAAVVHDDETSLHTLYLAIGR